MYSIWHNYVRIQDVWYYDKLFVDDNDYVYILINIVATLPSNSLQLYCICCTLYGTNVVQFKGKAVFTKHYLLDDNHSLANTLLANVWLRRYNLLTKKT